LFLFIGDILFLVLPINQFAYHPPFFFAGFFGGFKFYPTLITAQSIRYCFESRTFQG
jgi:hypothetical protein